jgi:predicted ATPase/class 3 adenylate cyclase
VSITQPSGTVTFLLSDIEGSTKLLAELGTDRYARALDDHRRLLREAFDRHGGYEVDYEGDAFVVAFQSAEEALAAAVEAQRALAVHDWGDAPEIRVRIGIHSGEPLLAAPKYVGLDVHTTARIMAAAHGGQVLVSAATAALAGGDGLRDLGEHRLKDIPEPVALFQLGDGAFPPLRTISNTNLPRPASSFVGRARELRELDEFLRREDVRLLTLTGPGGTGKTRLALEAATARVDDHPAGVFWVALASLRDPALVTETIAQTLGAKDGLAEHVGDRDLLLVLDNLEQVIEAAPELAALLERCPKLKLLVTSRELLQVRGETEYAVPPLAETEAIALFCERAQTQPRAEVEELCARLDSLPLAVELAAARARILSPTQILDRLAQRLDLLKAGRDADARQQTLRATIEWSYELLSPEEGRLFARLSVFAGGCTLEAAEAVCDADLDALQALVDKSLVRHSNERFWMLETIRAYASERLAADDEVRVAHAEWYARVAERAGGELDGPEQISWLRLLEDEHDNMRAALIWASKQGRAELFLRLTAALRSFWYKHGHIAEASGWFDRAVRLSPGQPSLLRARVLEGASVFAGIEGDQGRAEELARDGLVLYRELGDRRGTAVLLRNLGAAAVKRGDYPATRRLHEECASICRELGDRRLLANTTLNLGDLAAREGDLERASELTHESLALARELGATFEVALALILLGFVAVRQGRSEEAQVALEEGMMLAYDLGSSGDLAYAFEALAGVAAARSDWDQAAKLLGRSEAIRGATGIDLEVVEREVHEQTLRSLRAAWSDSAIQAGLAAGRELSDEDAIRLGLSLRSAAHA